jgi:CRISPR system Cascade subunit CasE
MSGLHLLRLPVHVPTLMASARAQGHLDSRGSADLGYLVHGLLARLAEHPPTPFDVQSSRHGLSGTTHAPLTLLAYARDGIGAFRDGAFRRDAALARSAIVWEQDHGAPEAASRLVPRIDAGTALGFRVRVCPTVRIGKHHPRLEHGAEVDPYHALVQRGLGERLACEPEGDAEALKREIVGTLPEREEIYRDWLAARMAGGAALLSARIVSLRDATLWRKGEPGASSGRLTARRMYDGARRRHGPRTQIGRREAVFEGMLLVKDADAFAALLARGVGRHRAFGFGMLLLRPA